MIKGRNEKEQAIIDLVVKTGNQHVLYFWDVIDNNQKDSLIAQLGEVDFDKVGEYFNKYKNESYEIGDITPTGCFTVDQIMADKSINSIGDDALKSGAIGFVTVAGGQASRLGYEKPKGCFPISPVKHKTLFQLFSEKVLFYSKHYNIDLYWFIMTSEANNTDTVNFFKENNFFGLKSEQVKFFVQGMLPTITVDGKLILSDRSRLFTNPDGHGGILTALMKSGLLDFATERGIKHLSYFQVDNPLVAIVDTAFIGHHIKSKSCVSSKVIPKLYPDEKLGAICRRNGKNDVVEYSDLPKEKMYETDESGKLKYLMGSIAIHIFEVEFLKHFTKHLEIHFAKKKIKGYLFDNGKEPVIAETDGIKFETFVFNTIPLSPVSVFFETDRNEEFFPLKNKTGVDSIETCIDGQNRLYFDWLKSAGIIEADCEYTGQRIEISPLFASDRNIFIKRCQKELLPVKQSVIGSNGKIKDEIFIG